MVIITFSSSLSGLLNRLLYSSKHRGIQPQADFTAFQGQKVTIGGLDGGMAQIVKTDFANACRALRQVAERGPS